MCLFPDVFISLCGPPTGRNVQLPVPSTDKGGGLAFGAVRLENPIIADIVLQPGRVRDVHVSTVGQRQARYRIATWQGPRRARFYCGPTTGDTNQSPTLRSCTICWTIAIADQLHGPFDSSPNYTRMQMWNNQLTDVRATIKFRFRFS